jgi:hypothetical protein
VEIDMGALFRGVPAESAAMFRALQQAREIVYLRQVDEDGSLRRFAQVLPLKRGCRR